MTQRLDAHARGMAVSISLALFVDYLIYGATIPLGTHSPAVANPGQLGYLFAGYAAGVLIATPLYGYFGARTSCRRLMIVGVVLSAVSVYAIAFAQSLPVLLAGRFLLGAASAGSWIAGLSLIARHVPDQRVETMAYALMASTLGSLMGPLVGGGLYQLSGYALPFVLLGVFVVLDAVLRLTLLPADSPYGDIRTRSYLRAMFADRAVAITAAAIALAALSYGIVEPLLPHELNRQGVGAETVGLIFTAGSGLYAAVSLLVSRLTQLVGLYRTIAFGTIIVAAFLTQLAAGNGALGGAITFSGICVGYALMLNPTSAELGNAVDRLGGTNYTLAYSAYNLIYAVGQIAASFYAAIAPTHLGLRTAMLLLSAVLALVAVPLLALRSRPRAATLTAAKPTKNQGPHA